MGPRTILRCLAPLIVMLLFCRDADGSGKWCVASPSASDEALQKGLDYVCGQGDVDCSPIQRGGSCFDPNTIHDHASYAYNAYWQLGSALPAGWHGTNCDFDGTAIFTNTDPSTATCKYPSTRHAARSNTGDQMGETGNKA